MRWTVVPPIVQSPNPSNVTSRPEVAVALTVKSGSLATLLGIGANEMLCGTDPATPSIENDCSTDVAGAKIEFPSCEAVMVQVPPPVMCTVDPVT